MSGPGVIFKRCGCRDANRRRLEQSCPRFSERGHGTWYFHCSATNLLGRRERARRGGYPSQAAARQARDEFLAGTAADRTAQGWTVERWLRHWLDSRTSIRPTTRFHYTREVDTVLIPTSAATGWPTSTANCCAPCSPPSPTPATTKAARNPPQR
jgi:hypothetical protein